MSKQDRARTRTIRDFMWARDIPRYADAARQLDASGRAGYPFQSHCRPLGSCESRRGVNPADDSDSSSSVCHRCRNYVCLHCQRNRVQNLFCFCDPCFESFGPMDY